MAKRMVLAELQRVVSHQYSAADTLDSKLKQLLGSASLILSVVTALQITAGIERIGWLYLAGLVVALLLYVLFILVILRGLRPMTYYAPVPPTWEEIAEYYFGEDEDTTLNLLISSYLDYKSANDEPLAEKARMVRYASVLFVFIVVTLFLMGIIGLSGTVVWPWQSSPLRTPTPVPWAVPARPRPNLPVHPLL